MVDSIDYGNRKAKPPGGGFVAHLAVFLNHMSGDNFSAVLQVDGIGKYASGNGQGKA